MDKGQKDRHDYSVRPPSAMCSWCATPQQHGTHSVKDVRKSHAQKRKIRDCGLGFFEITTVSVQSTSKPYCRRYLVPSGYVSRRRLFCSRRLPSQANMAPLLYRRRRRRATKDPEAKGRRTVSYQITYHMVLLWRRTTRSCPPSSPLSKYMVCSRTKHRPHAKQPLSQLTVRACPFRKQCHLVDEKRATRSGYLTGKKTLVRPGERGGGIERSVGRLGSCRCLVRRRTGRRSGAAAAAAQPDGVVCGRQSNTEKRAFSAFD